MILYSILHPILSDWCRRAVAEARKSEEKARISRQWAEFEDALARMSRAQALRVMRGLERAQAKFDQQQRQQQQQQQQQQAEAARRDGRAAAGQQLQRLAGIMRAGGVALEDAR
jgi:hypothetical protein